MNLLYDTIYIKSYKIQANVWWLQLSQWLPQGSGRGCKEFRGDDYVYYLDHDNNFMRTCICQNLSNCAFLISAIYYILIIP